LHLNGCADKNMKSRFTPLYDHRFIGVGVVAKLWFHVKINNA